MGLLTEGQPLTWEETKKLADHVRQHGVNQFVNLYHQLLDRRGDVLKWGDEVSAHFGLSFAVLCPFFSFYQVEYIIVKFDHAKKTAKVRLCAQEILRKLNEKEAKDPE